VIGRLCNYHMENCSDHVGFKFETSCTGLMLGRFPVRIAAVHIGCPDELFVVFLIHSLEAVCWDSAAVRLIAHLSRCVQCIMQCCLRLDTLVK
jgi:hypothetical protein